MIRSAVFWFVSRSRMMQIACIVLFIYLLLGIFGDLLITHPPLMFDLKALGQPPSFSHLLGTDQFGRDIFSRVVSGTRLILILSFFSTLLGVGAGTAVGMLSGYYTGKIDEIIMRIMDILMALPGLVLGLLVITAFGPSKINLILCIAAIFAPRTSRVARSGTLTIRNLGYVEVARLRGQHVMSILLTELLPNIREILAVEFCLRFVYSVLLTSSLGFLGLGVQPPTPDWGLMISEGRNFISTQPWVVLFPALAIAILAVAANIFSDGLWYDRYRFDAARLR